MKKVVCYINQFFGGMGGEEKGDIQPLVLEGCRGPAAEIDKRLENAVVTHTIVCGDNYFGSHMEHATDEIIEMLKNLDFDYLIAGPAFNAGRYGIACGQICKVVTERLRIPAVTSMCVENPGVKMYKSHVMIFEGGQSASKMREDIGKMTRFVNKSLAGFSSEGAEAEGYFSRGCRHEVFLEDVRENTAAYRGVQMLIKKIKGLPYRTELVIPDKEVIPVAPAVKELRNATVALVTSGGIVPLDNPDRIQSASATRWGKYDIGSMERLSGLEFKTIHAGFDPAAACEDPNRIVPVDAMRYLEKQGVFRKLHAYFYSTVGTGTTEAEAKRMATEMLPHLRQDGVSAILLTST